jgi:Protein of unknown function (DUF1523)
MATNIRRLWASIAIGLVIAAGPLAFLDYVLPHHAVLRLVGTEVKRFGKDGTAGQGTARTIDVRYIYTEDIETKKPHVFRNEDTGWGFPWYFKFNSADIEAAAQSIAQEHGTAALTYYGWRIQLFSWFPNVTKIKRAEPGTSVIPWFNIVFFAVVIGGSLRLAWRFRAIRDRRRLAREGARAPRRN